MLEIQKFCKAHPDNYEELLESEHAIKTKKDGKLVLFKYNQIKSNFNEEIVRECRGIILEEGTWEIICHPYYKFFNYGESQAIELNWKHAKITGKEDGSLIKLYYYDGDWRIATNGTISAFSADLQTPFYAEEWDMQITSYGQLFLYTMSELYGIKNWDFLYGTEDYTHMIELCSPFNKIVVKYDDPKLFYISSKRNETGAECEYDFGMDKVKKYSLSSLDDCIALVKDFDCDHEGLVACDHLGNRVKIKSPLYVHLHHLRGEIFTEKHALDVIRLGEMEELLNYFPEFRPTILQVEMKYDAFINNAKNYIQYLAGLNDVILNDRKRFAKQVVSSDFKDLSFQWLDGKVENVEDYYAKMTTDKLLEKL